MNFIYNHVKEGALEWEISGMEKLSTVKDSAGW
jgi:hypothetical protein